MLDAARRAWLPLLQVCLFVILVAADSRDGNWRQLTTSGTPPSVRDNIAAVAFGDDIYTFGGFHENLDPTNPIENEFYNDMFTFNVVTQTWTELTPNPDPSFGIPPPRGFPVYGRDGYNFIIGFGITYTAAFDNITTFNDLWSYNILTNTWAQIRPNHDSDAPSERAMSVGDVFGGKIHLFGGITDTFTTLGDTWVYDIGTDEWTQINTTTAPTGRYGAITALDRNYGRLWVYGGERSEFNGQGLDFTFAGPDAQWYLDLSSTTWHEVTPSPNIDPHRNNGNGAVWIAGKLILFGGDVGGGTACDNIAFLQNNVNETWTYSEATNSWTHLCPSAAPPNFKRATSVLVESTWYLFGGFAFDTATCGPFILNQDMWAFTVAGGDGGPTCAASSGSTLQSALVWLGRVWYDYLLEMSFF